MREKSLKVRAPDGAIDTCGTGGSGHNICSVSTAAALVVAACGVPVAKHGGRAASSRCGSADVLRALGVNTDIAPEQVKRCLQQAGIGFLFAAVHHPAMRHVAPVRRKLAARSIFNLLGPLCNPANTRRQLLGVFSADWLPRMAEALRNLGSERAWLVHGAGGLDELSCAGSNQVIEIRGGGLHRFELAPEALGLERNDIESLRGGDAEENARALRALLAGEQTPYRDVVLLNAAAALTVAGDAEAEDMDALQGNIGRAAEAIDSGKAARRLELLAKVSNEAAA